MVLGEVFHEIPPNICVYRSLAIQNRSFHETIHYSDILWNPPILGGILGQIFAMFASMPLLYSLKNMTE